MTHPIVPKDAAVYVTADHHFYHDNIRRYCERPFRNVEEMNAEMERLWNETVGPEDVVLYLGDFCMTTDRWSVRRLFERLHGTKYLVRGSHDDYSARDLGWRYVWKEHLVYRGVVLTHDGEAYRRSNLGSAEQDRLIFCAHVHELWKVRENMLNCGVDVHHFRPVRWEQAASYLQRRYDYWRDMQEVRKLREKNL